MDPENDIDAMEIEFQEVKDELKAILFDIRTYLMEVQSPIPTDLKKKSQGEELRAERG